MYDIETQERAKETQERTKETCVFAARHRGRGLYVQ